MARRVPRSRNTARTCRGSNTAAGNGNGPSSTRVRVITPPTTVRTDVVTMTSRQPSPPRPFTRCGTPWLTVNAPTRRPSAAPRPCRYQVEISLSGRVDPRDEEAGGEPGGDAEADTLRDQEQQVGAGRPQRTQEDQPGRGDRIGNGEHCREQRAGDEAPLHRDRQPRDGLRRELPLRAHLWDHRGRGEPRRHEQQRRRREHDEGGTWRPTSHRSGGAPRPEGRDGAAVLAGPRTVPAARSPLHIGVDAVAAGGLAAAP